jgi:hypothetical protein
MSKNLLKKICQGNVNESDLLSGIYILKDGFCLDPSTGKRYTEERRLNEAHKNSVYILLPDNGRQTKLKN